jgi:hypothetical protein
MDDCHFGYKQKFQKKKKRKTMVKGAFWKIPKKHCHISRKEVLKLPRFWEALGRFLGSSGSVPRCSASLFVL